MIISLYPIPNLCKIIIMKSVTFTYFFQLIITVLLLCHSTGAHARGLIRDAEIEHVLKTYSHPIFEAAGLVPENINLFIIDSNDINAFVAGGSNIFLHTGLIKASETPGMLIGVIAHETGHISGGHLLQGAEKLKDAQLGAVLGYILGAAAMVSGAPEAGAAILYGSQSTIQRQLLSYSRVNEQAADQAALRYLDENNYSAAGLLNLFELLRKQEDRRFGKPDPYTLTHPLSKERIINVRNHVMQRGEEAADSSSMYEDAHKRVLAKLRGSTNPLAETLQRYPVSDTSLEARYARAIAYYRVPDFKNALKEIDGLIKQYPKDPYFHEARGQFLFESGQVKPALVAYRKAISLLPSATLIRVDLAKAQLASQEAALITEARINLERATTEDKTNPGAWRLLASAYGKEGTIGLSYLCLAEEASLLNQPEISLRQSELAIKSLPADSPAHLRAQDLKNLAEEQLRKKL